MKRFIVFLMLATIVAGAFVSLRAQNVVTTPVIDPPSAPNPLPAPNGAFLGVFKQGAGPVSSTVGGFAGTTFKASEALGGIAGYGGGYWTKSGSSVLAGVLKRVGSVGDFTAYCTATAGLASEVTTGLAGSAGCLATFPLAKIPRFGAALDKLLPGAEVFGGAAVFGANVTGYDLGGRKTIPGFGLRFPWGR